jgi:hypothetical protein
VNTVAFVLAVIIGLLIAETLISWRHERALRARGAHRTARRRPVGASRRSIPPHFVIMGSRRSLSRGGPPEHTRSRDRSGSVLVRVRYGAVRGEQGLEVRGYSARSASGWSFRVLIVPGLPLVATGPIATVRHPNYIAVVGELVGTAMMVGRASPVR